VGLAKIKNNMSKQTLDNFVAEVIDGWMCGDIENLENIPHRLGQPGNCNFPIALYVFACTEFLGQLTARSPVPKQGGTKKAILDYIEEFFPDEFKEELKPHRNRFVNLFRHGLAHNYFAKASGVSRTRKTHFSIDQGRLILDADMFAQSFVESTKKLKIKIKNDQKLAQVMVGNYNKQYNDNLKYLPPNASRYLRRHTVTSTASTAHPDMVKGVKTFSSGLKNNPVTTTTLPPELIKNK